MQSAFLAGYDCVVMAPRTHSFLERSRYCRRFIECRQSLHFDDFPPASDLKSEIVANDCIAVMPVRSFPVPSLDLYDRMTDKREFAA